MIFEISQPSGQSCEHVEGCRRLQQQSLLIRRKALSGEVMGFRGNK